MPAATSILLFFGSGVSAGLTAILFRALNVTFAGRVGTLFGFCIGGHDEFLSAQIPIPSKTLYALAPRDQWLWDACQSGKFGGIKRIRGRP
jgi:hypothetical protein